MWCKMRFDILNCLGVDRECDGRIYIAVSNSVVTDDPRDKKTR